MIARFLKPTLPTAIGRRGWRERLRAESGFTIVETLAAAIVLVVGLLTAYMMLDVSVHSSQSVRDREGAVGLARQITEDARAIPYSQLSNSTLVSTLQAMPGLASSSSGSAWTIVRDGVTYTVTATESPGYDSKDPGNASGNTTVDFKQITVTVSWTTFSGLSHQYSETAMVTRAGQDPGLIASNLQLAGAGAFSSYLGSATAPVIYNSGTTWLTFEVTAPAGTEAIDWTLNGAKQPSWDGAAPTGTTWTSAPWSLSGLSDGTYTVGAMAQDANGHDGPAVTIPVRLIRNVPSAPNVTNYGFNPNVEDAGTAAELQWTPNPELNVVGYEILNSSGQVICTTNATNFSSDCGPDAWCSSPTECIDLSQSSTSNPVTYTVKALYYDVNNNLQAGTGDTVTIPAGTPVPPGQPTNLQVATQLDGTAILTWTPPSGGTAVAYYWIYRGTGSAQSYTDRYDTLSASSCTTVCTYHDTSRSAAYTYWVTAVGGTTPGSNVAESQPSNEASG